MQRLLVILFITGLMLGFATPPAQACSCVAPEAQQLLANSDFAFVGSIIDRQPLGQPGSQALYTFAVSGWAKGNLGETVTVASPDNGAACGFELAPGFEAAIFVSKVDGQLQGGLCSTMDAASLAALGPLDAPVENTAPPPGEIPPPNEPADSPSPVIAVALGTAAVVAAVAVYWRRRLEA